MFLRNANSGNQYSKYFSTKPVVIKPSEVFEFCCRCMNSVGTKPEHSKALANVLLAADYSGHYSHGLNRLGILTHYKLINSKYTINYIFMNFVKTYNKLG